MKITERLVRTAALSFIAGASGIAIILWMLNPALLSYNPEDPVLFAEQKLVAVASIFAGTFCAFLFSKR